jgi:putative transcriptional regulator
MNLIADDVSEQLTAAHAAGALGPALSLLVQTRALLLEDCADDLAVADAIAGAAFEQEMPVDMGAGALDAVFARIDLGEEPLGRAQARAGRLAGAALEEVLGLPAPVRDAALQALAVQSWKFAGPGLRSLSLPLPGECRAEILRIEPGAGAPRHTHRGGEYTLVLQGAFRDEGGRYGRGDLAVAGPGIEHRPFAEPGKVCFALAVTEAPLELSGALGLIQRFLRDA